MARLVEIGRRPSEGAPADVKRHIPELQSPEAKPVLCYLEG